MKRIYLVVGFGFVFGSCEMVDDEVDREGNLHYYALMDADGLVVPKQSVSPQNTSFQVLPTQLDLCLAVETDNTVIDLNTEAPLFDGELVIRKNVSSSNHVIMAMSYTNGDETIVHRYDWSVEDEAFAAFNSFAWDNNRVEIDAKKDLFDNDGSEPSSAATVCAMNACDQTLGCQTFTITGIVNLEGDWLVYGTGSTSPFEIHLQQTGRTIRLEPTFGKVLQGTLEQNNITFTTGPLLYSGTFTSRTHCDGTVTDLHLDTLVGIWVADKQPSDYTL